MKTNSKRITSKSTSTQCGLLDKSIRSFFLLTSSRGKTKANETERKQRERYETDKDKNKQQEAKNENK